MPAAKGLCSDCGFWIWRNFDHDCPARVYHVWCSRAGVPFDEAGVLVANTPQQAAARWLRDCAPGDIDASEIVSVQQAPPARQPTVYTFTAGDVRAYAVT